MQIDIAGCDGGVSENSAGDETGVTAAVRILVELVGPVPIVVQGRLIAGREVEDALVALIQYQLQARSLAESVKEAEDSVQLVVAQYRGGLVDFNRVFTTQAQLVTQQDQLASAQGNRALSLIAVFRALGGGWQTFENIKEPATCLELATP